MACGFVLEGLPSHKVIFKNAIIQTLMEEVTSVGIQNKFVADIYEIVSI